MVHHQMGAVRRTWGQKPSPRFKDGTPGSGSGPSSGPGSGGPSKARPAFASLQEMAESRAAPRTFRTI